MIKIISKAKYEEMDRKIVGLSNLYNEELLKNKQFSEEIKELRLIRLDLLKDLDELITERDSLKKENTTLKSKVTKLENQIKKTEKEEKKEKQIVKETIKEIKKNHKKKEGK